MLGLINVILTMLGKINDSDHSKYHMYDSVPSYILIFFRIVAFVAFFIGICVTLYFFHNFKNKKIRNFYRIYAILGALYFLSLPLVMGLSTIFKETERE